MSVSNGAPRSAMPMAALDASDCPVCGRAGTIVAPVCVDGHDGECPDRLCVDCGIALLVDPLLTFGGAPARRSA